MEQKPQTLSLALLVGAESKAWLADLKSVVTRLEALQTTGTGAQTEYHEGKDEEAKPAKTGKGKAATTKPVTKKAAQVEEEEESFEVPSDDEGEAETEEADEAPEVTRKELLKVAKANRDAAIKWMQKRKIKSIDDLPKSKWAEFVNAFN